MRRFSLCLVVVLASLVAAPVALADGGPVLVTDGGAGVSSPSHPGLHYVAVSDGAGATLLETVDASYGRVFGWARLPGDWGIPTIGTGSPLGQGLSQDGRTLVLGTVGIPYASPSRFLVVDARRMKAARTIVLPGDFSFDALSPNGSRIYFIQYTSAGDLTHYVVRAYDLRSGRLLPGKIAARSDPRETMAGTPVTRTTSAGGRWVYTLYEKPSGGAFIHALDTVGSVAYCIDLPRNSRIYEISLALRDDDRTLTANWPKGGTWLRVAVGSWRISYPGGSFPWAWLGGGIGAGAALLVAAALLRWRRRGEKLEQRAGQELGLA